MSTSSGSRVRREGTIAMSSNPYARRAFLPRPISTSITASYCPLRTAAGRSSEACVRGRSRDGGNRDDRAPDASSGVRALLWQTRKLRNSDGQPRRPPPRADLSSLRTSADLRADVEALGFDVAEQL